MKKIICLLILISGLMSYGQAPPCATDAVMENLLNNNPAAKQKMDAFDRQMFMNKSSGVNFIAPPPGSITIPVVVYVVSDGPSTATDISDQQVNQQLLALNNYFTSTGIKFCLAKKAGGTTTTIPVNSGDTHSLQYPAIVHVTNTTLTNYSTSGNQQAFLNTANAAITGDRYLRIWVVKSINGTSSGILGYAPLPNLGLELDGVVIRYDVFGNGTPNLLANYNQGKVLVHEVGHYLNLWHTFQGGCSQTDCQFDGDRVCDTPPVGIQNFSCTPMTNSCNESPIDYNDLINNYMDYGNHTCVTSFTDGQIERMVNTANTERSMLTSSDNIVHTGSCGSENIIASKINASANQTCASATNSVNLSVTLTPTATYSWSFGDGTSATGPNVSHIYSTAVGSPFTVTLTITRGAQTVVSSTQIYVSQCTVMNNSEANWYVSFSSALKFNTGIPVFDDNFLETNTGTYALATQNDTSGNILFYTNKRKVWNSQHQPITTIDIDNDSTMKDSSVLILPRPSTGSTSQYYIFTNTSATAALNSTGFRYHIVNVSGSSVSMGTIKVPITTPATEGFLSAPDLALKGGEGITAIKKCSSNDYWIITTLKTSSATYLVVYSFTSATANGGLTYISKFPSSINADFTSLEASPNGNKIYQYINQGGGNASFVYDFDKVSGQISVPVQITSLTYNTTATFSPDSKLLYVAESQRKIFQYNLNAINVSASKVAVITAPNNYTGLACMQLGPDNKIYVSGSGSYFDKRYAVIHNPNNLATSSNPNACNFSFNGPIKNFGTSSLGHGISNVVDAKASTAYPGTNTSISAYVTGCKTYKFFADYCTSGHRWDFGDPASGAANTFIGTTPSHTFSGPGNYTVRLKNFANLQIASFPIQITNNTPVITGSTTACPVITTNSGTNNATTLLAGETALWTITGGVGTITGANNQSSVTINWSTLPGIITLAVTNANGCTTTTTRQINVSPNCSCDCLSTLYAGIYPQLDDLVLYKVKNSNPNPMCSNLNLRYTWTFPNLAPIVTTINSIEALSSSVVVLIELINGTNGSVICSVTRNYGNPPSNGRFSNTILNDEVKVTPNPSTGIFNMSINNFEGKINIQVLDINGRMVYDAKEESFQNEKAIDLSFAQSGMYILKVTGEGINYSEKIIKN